MTTEKGGPHFVPEPLFRSPWPNFLKRPFRKWEKPQYKHDGERIISRTRHVCDLSFSLNKKQILKYTCAKHLALLVDPLGVFFYFPYVQTEMFLNEKTRPESRKRARHCGPEAEVPGTLVSTCRKILNRYLISPFLSLGFWVHLEAQMT